MAGLGLKLIGVQLKDRNFIESVLNVHPIVQPRVYLIVHLIVQLVQQIHLFKQLKQFPSLMNLSLAQLSTACLWYFSSFFGFYIKLIKQGKLQWALCFLLTWLISQGGIYWKTKRKRKTLSIVILFRMRRIKCWPPISGWIRSGRTSCWHGTPRSSMGSPSY